MIDLLKFGLLLLMWMCTLMCAGGLATSDNDSCDVSIPTDQSEKILGVKTTASELTELPQWITNYFLWHNDIRAKFPGGQLIDHPDSPGVIVRTCERRCGGLHDRVGQLPYDLLAANLTQRVLLLKWYAPRNLEDFLDPNVIDWRVPDHEQFSNRVNMVRNSTHIMKGVPRNDPNFFVQGVDQAANGTFKDQKVLYYQNLGKHEEFENRLLELGESDMIHNSKSYGELWHAMFHPVKPLEEFIHSTFQSLNLRPGAYTAMHMRVRHPAAYPPGMEVLGKKGRSADAYGLKFENGPVKDFVIKAAIRAIQCSKLLLKKSNEAIYFLADSEDLVEYMVSDLVAAENLEQLSETDLAAIDLLSMTTLVARNQTFPTVHLDMQHGQPLEAYYNTFVDLYIAMNARCVCFGVGNYGYFAAKLSSTDCLLQHQKPEETAMQYNNVVEENVPSCQL